ncbi:hypothetical protein CBR_g49280 [Chara braunii]|uniref:Uncharacterized protein n=1 Tax=Chara braunii TaxID=69332 RepID=A0A388M4U3_CHABU|nr:hypothetical protein CBR_g49280 [Chara braunii]|eukprot:GBG89489.1 hypothetical protein CBR_g49280 [Chara braunii]
MNVPDDDASSSSSSSRGKKAGLLLTVRPPPLDEAGEEDTALPLQAIAEAFRIAALQRSAAFEIADDNKNDGDSFDDGNQHGHVGLYHAGSVGNDEAGGKGIGTEMLSAAAAADIQRVDKEDEGGDHQGSADEKKLGTRVREQHQDDHRGQRSVNRARASDQEGEKGDGDGSSTPACSSRSTS